VYAHSGMEIVFYTGLLFAGYLLMLEVIETGRRGWLAGLLFGLAAITRMEAVGFAGLAAMIVLVFSRQPKRWLHAGVLSLVFGLVFLPVLAWRWHYYGYPLPISYYVKVDGGGLLLAARGLYYLLSWLLTNLLVVSGFLLVWRFFRQKLQLSKPALIALVWIAVHIAYTIYVGGDYMPYNRFFVPLIPIFALLLAELWPRWIKAAAERQIRPKVYTSRRLATYLILSQCWTFLYPFHLIGLHHEKSIVKGWRMMGTAIQLRIDDRSTVMHLGIAGAGALPYYSKLRCYDSLGLADPVLAHKKTNLGKGIAGHEKFDMRRILEIRPDIIAYQTFDVRKPIKNLPYYRTDETGQKFYVDAYGVSHPVAKSAEKTGYGISLLGQHEELVNLFDDENFRAQYQVMRFRDTSMYALFYVRRDAKPSALKAFEPVTLAKGSD